MSYMKTPEIEEYMLTPSMNGKYRQSCNVRVEIAPEEADYFFNKDY